MTQLELRNKASEKLFTNIMIIIKNKDNMDEFKEALENVYSILDDVKEWKDEE